MLLTATECRASAAKAFLDARLEEPVAGVKRRFDENDATRYFASADGPWEDPLEGTAMQILLNRCGSETALRDWLAAFARAMNDLGAAGTLKPQREREYPSWEMPLPSPQLTAFIAYDTRGVPDERAGDARRLAARFARPVVGGDVLAAARAAFGPMIRRH